MHLETCSVLLCFTQECVIMLFVGHESTSLYQASLKPTRLSHNPPTPSIMARCTFVHWNFFFFFDSVIDFLFSSERERHLCNELQTGEWLFLQGLSVVVVKFSVTANITQAGWYPNTVAQNSWTKSDFCFSNLVFQIWKIHNNRYEPSGAAAVNLYCGTGHLLSCLAEQPSDLVFPSLLFNR